MADGHALLATYLNDHLSGATSALELLRHLAEAYAGQEVAYFADELSDEIAADVATLERIASDLGIGRSPLRKAAAWAVEKVAWLKLRVDDPSMRGLHLLESMEALSLGIEGKRLLWVALSAAAAAGSPALAGRDYAGLIARAEAQRAEVERRRVAAAQAVLG